MTLLDTLAAQPPPLRLDADGVVRVGCSRVPLETVIDAYQHGAVPEEIVEAFDSLTLADVHAVISHYLRHRAEVDQYLAERRRVAETVRRENENRFPQEGIRERLLARKRGRA